MKTGIEQATPWELQGMLESIDRELQQLQFQKMQLEYAKNDLKIALCLKINGQHRFELADKNYHGDNVYMCSCGALKRD